MGISYRVLVTGDRDDWPMVAIEGIEWKSVPVLRYERLPVKPELLERLDHKPVEWMVFTSPRAVRFWSEVLLESGYELPVETRVACLGERTAEVASEDGYTVDFYPREPGTDGFLSQFEAVLREGNASTLLIPAAEGGRTKLRDRLKQIGCEVTSVALYRTLAREDLAESLTVEELKQAHAIVFTSPSSVEAVLDHFSLPEQLQVVAIGGFTGHQLEQRGFCRPKLLPNGDFSRLGEVLC